MELPSTWQSPHPRRDQFHGIAGRVAKVNGPTSCRPFDYFLSENTVGLQVLPPSIQGLPFNSQGEMAWPLGPMCGKPVALQRRLSQECQQDAGIANLKENMTANLFADHSQAEDWPVELLGGIEVIDVNGGFNNGLDSHLGPTTLVAASRHDGPGVFTPLKLHGIARHRAARAPPYLLL
jgi:hypothetical protein